MNPLEMIAAERKRQLEVEGWTPDHDDCHDSGELAMAAACYAAPQEICVEWTPPRAATQYVDAWPWEAEFDKRDQHDRRRQLVIAGALIVAELERLERAESSRRR